jgi:hypothetical protein
MNTWGQKRQLGPCLWAVCGALVATSCGVFSSFGDEPSGGDGSAGTAGVPAQGGTSGSSDAGKGGSTVSAGGFGQGGMVGTAGTTVSGCSPPVAFPPADCGSEFLTDSKNCCVLGHDCVGEPCVQGQCQPKALIDTKEIDSLNPENYESLAVASSGNDVLWSTGYGHRLYHVDPANGAWVQLAEVANDQYVTAVALDTTNAYWLNWGGGQVHRVSLNGGTATEVGQFSTALARFASVYVGTTHVYAAGYEGIVADGAGVFRLEKNATQAVAEKVDTTPGIFAEPFGVQGDDSYVYWTDHTRQEIRRIRHDKVGIEPSELFVSDAEIPVNLALDELFVYWITNNGVVRKLPKDKSSGTSSLATFSNAGTWWGLVVDDAFVYATSNNPNGLFKTRKEGGMKFGQLFSSNVGEFRYLSQDCRFLYWTDSAGRKLYKMAK